MKKKFEDIRTKLTQMQATSHSLVSDIDVLLGEMEAKSKLVEDLDAKATRLREVEAKLSAAQKELADVQRTHASVTQRLQEMKNSIQV
jgi:predicted nuclease with TOPRIM domain